MTRQLEMKISPKKVITEMSHTYSYVDVVSE